MSHLQVILKERVPKLGQMGDTVKVKRGYALNYLFPQKKAERATDENLKRFEEQKAHLEAQNLTFKNEATSVAQKVEGTKLTMVRQASEAGMLYGSVRSQDIAALLEAQGVTITKQQVVIEQPIKTLGLHRIVISLHPEVSTYVDLAIALTDEEAKNLFVTKKGRNEEAQKPSDA